MTIIVFQATLPILTRFNQGGLAHRCGFHQSLPDRNLSNPSAQKCDGELYDQIPKPRLPTTTRETELPLLSWFWKDAANRTFFLDLCPTYCYLIE
jgi:hypothetical protein